MKELGNKPISAVFAFLKLNCHIVCVCVSHTHTHAYTYTVAGRDKFFEKPQI